MTEVQERSSSVLASRRFTLEDQKSFAQLSGDVNPIHMDEMAARRSVVGTIVVHGVHMLSWSLDVLAKSRIRPPGLIKIDVQFQKPIYLDEELALILQSKTEGEIRLKVMVGNRVAASIRLGCSTDQKPRSEDGIPPDTMPLVPGEQAEDLTIDAILGKAGRVDFAASVQEFAAAFPDAAALTGASRLRGVAACSRLYAVRAYETEMGF